MEKNTANFIQQQDTLDIFHRAIEIAADSQELFEHKLDWYRNHEFESQLDADRFHATFIVPRATKACAQAELIRLVFGLSEEAVHELIQEAIEQRNECEA